MIRVVLILVLPLALPWMVWKTWRLFGPAEEIRHPPGAGQPGAEPPWIVLAAIGVLLVGITLTYLVLTSDSVPAQ